MTKSKRVAIIGGGVSGLAALWALKDTEHEVHLYEADTMLGGHTNTVKFTHGDEEVNVDTGFIVFNMATYPNFIKFLEAVGVKAVPTEMTFGVSRDVGAFEWSGTSLSSIFAQWGNLFSVDMWRMIYDIIRFNQFALDILKYEDIDVSENGKAAIGDTKSKALSEQSIGEYLDRNGYSQAFRDDYLIPMTASVWSTKPDKCALEFPAVTLVRFMWNHHLLTTVARRPDWMTIPGGSQQYIDAILKQVSNAKIHLESPVVNIEDINDKLIVQFDDFEAEELFDHVILACHGDQAYGIVADGATEEERDVLSAFQTSRNIAYLHSDLSLMPQRRVTWSSWNYLTTSVSNPSSQEPTSKNIDQVCLTYNMNILQHIPTSKYGDVLVTLNPLHTPDPALTQGCWTYHHPIYNAASVRAQKALKRIQNTRGISYCGAWTKYGFHEDGFTSGLQAAVEYLGGSVPWEGGVVDSTYSRGRRPQLGLADYILRLVLWYIGLWVALADLLVRVSRAPARWVAAHAPSESARKGTKEL